MALLAFTDQVLLGALDVSDRLLGGRVAFGGDPYGNQAYLSTGTLDFDNEDGALDALGDTTLRITRPPAHGQAALEIWRGRARRDLVPETLETRATVRYELTGLLETALGYAREVSFRQGADHASNPDVDAPPGTLAETIRAVLAKALTAGGIPVVLPVVDVIDIGTITVRETDADGRHAAVAMRGTDWLRTIADITHTRPCDYHGRGVAVSRGAQTPANRPGRYVSNSLLLMLQGALRVEERTIQNVFENSQFESQVPASIAQYGERPVRLPDWVPLSTLAGTLQVNAALPGQVIVFEAPRWQDTRAAMALLEGLTIGATARVRIAHGAQVVADDTGVVTRLTHTWRRRTVPRVRVEVCIYRHTASAAVFTLGRSRLGSGDVLA